MDLAEVYDYVLFRYMLISTEREKNIIQTFVHQQLKQNH